MLMHNVAFNEATLVKAMETAGNFENTHVFSRYVLATIRCRRLAKSAARSRRSVSNPPISRATTSRVGCTASSPSKH